MFLKTDYPEKVIKQLLEKNITVSTAESCTGGMLAEIITKYPGVSAIFQGGVVTYSNEAKEKLIKVKHETLEEFGAVSEQVAVEMAIGVRELFDSEIGISVTGIAGPGGATETKPVGLVYVGVSTKYEDLFYELRLKGGRHKIRQDTCSNVFKFLSERIKTM